MNSLLWAIGGLLCLLAALGLIIWWLCRRGAVAQAQRDRDGADAADKWKRPDDIP